MEHESSLENTYIPRFGHINATETSDQANNIEIPSRVK